MVNAFHSTFPVDASNATTLPRKVQQEDDLLAPVTSSYEETGTNNVVPTSVGEPVMTAAGWSSTLVFHSSLPVSASTE